MFEQDYIMRMIHEMVRTVLKLLFNIDEEKEDTGMMIDEVSDDYKGLNDELFRLADAGKINEAENMLYDRINVKDVETLKLALLFYNHINEYTSDFLEKADYSREEIKEGICSVLNQYGYGGMASLFIS